MSKNERLTNNETILIEKRKTRLKKRLDKIEKDVKWHKWDLGGAKNCEKDITWLKNKHVDVTSFQLRLSQLRETILNDQEYLKLNEFAIKERIKDCIWSLEDAVLMGKWDREADELLKDSEGEMNCLGLQAAASEQVKKIREVYQKNKTRKVETVFSESQLNQIFTIRRRIPSPFLFFYEGDDDARYNVLRQDLLKAKESKEEAFPQFCVELVRRNPYAVIFLKNPTMESCLMAIKKDIHILRFIEQTPELCMLVLEQNPEAECFFNI